MKGINMMRRTASRTRANDGQIIVIFALGLVAMIAMVGLVLDGGSTFAQRRAQQSAADLAALAGANEYFLDGDKAAAIQGARDVAAMNGFVHDPTAGKRVDVAFQQNDTLLVVDITSPHRNSFTGVVGMTQWQVSTTATVNFGIPDTAQGGPFIFNTEAFTDPGGVPKPEYSNENAPFSFGEGNGPIPQTPGDMAWTCYDLCSNLDSNTVRSMVDGTNPNSTTLTPSDDLSQLEYIGQYNSGNHATLFGEVRDLLAGQDLAVPIVDDNGLFQGWAMFHVVTANQGAKTLTGYFVSPFNQTDNLEVQGCSGTCPKPRYLGVYVLKLVN